MPLAGLALVAGLALSGGARADWCAVVGPADAPQAAAVVARAGQQLADPPHPLPRLHTEGLLPHQGERDAAELAARDFPAMRDAALAWRLTGDPRFARQADRILAAWMVVYAPGFNPIDETRLDALIEGYALARDGLAPGTRQAAEAFLRGLAEGYLARSTARRDPERGPGSATWINNWQSHRVKLVALAAAALGDGRLIERARSCSGPSSRPTLLGMARSSIFARTMRCATSSTTSSCWPSRRSLHRPFGGPRLHLPGDAGSAWRPRWPGWRPMPGVRAATASSPAAGCPSTARAPPPACRASPARGSRPMRGSSTGWPRGSIRPG
ncbi:MAG: alginate lyase family protein [Dongiaceae bacterium]